MFGVTVPEYSILFAVPVPTLKYVIAAPGDAEH
jgi:hypothetical protein